MKNKVLFLLLGLNLLIVSSITMSLAWFLGSISLNVDGMDIVVDVDAGLKISLDNNYDTAQEKLTASDFNEDVNFVPVSSMLVNKDSEWITDKDVKKPSLLAQYKRGNKEKPSQSIALKGFFQKKIYLFSDKHMMVTFDSDHSYVNSDLDENEIKAGDIALEKAQKDCKAIVDAELGDSQVSDAHRQYLYEKKADELAHSEAYLKPALEGLHAIKDCLRVSIFDHNNLGKNYSLGLDENGDEIMVGDYTIINPTKYNAETKQMKDPVVFGGRISTSITRDYYDYYIDTKSGELKETIFGDIVALDHDILYTKAADEDTSLYDESVPTSCFNSRTRKGVMAPDMDDLSSNVTFATEQAIAPFEADVSKHANNEGYGYLIELFPYQPHELTLTAYVEGWDPANVDGTQEATFEMGIHFRLLRQGDYY